MVLAEVPEFHSTRADVAQHQNLEVDQSGIVISPRQLSIERDISSTSVSLYRNSTTNSISLPPCEAQSSLHQLECDCSVDRPSTTEAFVS